MTRPIDLLLRFARTTYAEARKVLPNQTTNEELELLNSLLHEVEAEVRKIVVENHAGLVSQTSALNKLGDSFANATDQAEQLAAAAATVRQQLAPKLQMLERLTDRYIRAVHTQQMLRGCHDLIELTHSLRTTWTVVLQQMNAQSQTSETSIPEGANNTPATAQAMTTDVENASSRVTPLPSRALDAAHIAYRIAARAQSLAETVEKLPILATEIAEANRITSEIESQAKLSALNALANACRPDCTDPGQALKLVAGAFRVLLSLPSGLHRASVLVGEALSRSCKNNRAACRRTFDSASLASELQAMIKEGVALATGPTDYGGQPSQVGNILLKRMLALFDNALHNTAQMWALELVLSQLPSPQNFSPGNSKTSLKQSLLEAILPRIQVPSLASSPNDTGGVPGLTWAAWLSFLKDFSTEITKIMGAPAGSSRDTISAALAALDAAPIRLKTLMRTSLITDFVSFAFLLVDAQARFATGLLQSLRKLSNAVKIILTNRSNGRIVSASTAEVRHDEVAIAYEFASLVFEQMRFTFPPAGYEVIHSTSAIPPMLSYLNGVRTALIETKVQDEPTEKRSRTDPLSVASVANQLALASLQSQQATKPASDADEFMALLDATESGVDPDEVEELETAGDPHTRVFSSLLEATGMSEGSSNRPILNSLLPILELASTVVYSAGATQTGGAKPNNPGALLSHPRELYLLATTNEARSKANQISSPIGLALPSTAEVNEYIEIAHALLSCADALASSPGLAESIRLIVDSELCSVVSSLRDLVSIPEPIVTYTKTGHELVYVSVLPDQEMLGELTPSLSVHNALPSRTAGGGATSEEDHNAQMLTVLESNSVSLLNSLSPERLRSVTVSLLKGSSTLTPPQGTSSGSPSLRKTVDQLLAQISSLGVSKMQVDHAKIYLLVVYIIKIFDADALRQLYPRLHATYLQVCKQPNMGLANTTSLLSRSAHALEELAKAIYLATLQTFQGHISSTLALMHTQSYADDTCETSECPVEFFKVGTNSRGDQVQPLPFFPTSFYLSLACAQARVFVARVLSLYKVPFAPASLRLYGFAQLCKTTAEIAHDFVRSAALVCPIQDRGKLRLVAELAKFETHILEHLVPRAKLTAMTQLFESRSTGHRDGQSKSKQPDETEIAIAAAADAATDANYPLIVSNFREILCSPPDALQETARVVRDHLREALTTGRAPGAANLQAKSLSPQATWMITVRPLDLVHVLMCHSGEPGSSPAHLAKMSEFDYLRHIRVRSRSPDLLLSQVRRLWTKLIKTLYIANLRMQQHADLSRVGANDVDASSIDEDEVYSWLGKHHPTLVTAGALVSECIDLYKQRRQQHQQPKAGQQQHTTE